MKTNLNSKWKKHTFVFFLFIGVSIALITSSFRAVESNRLQVCNGAFYSTNIQGHGFGISFPSTGATGEPHATQGGGYHWITCNSCHLDHTNNSGPALVTFDIGGGITQYVPGQTYTVTITVSQAQTDFSHFQLTNRAPNVDTISSAGNFALTDNRSQLVQPGSLNGFGGSFLGLTNYVEATACGTDALSTGYNQWTFNWTAPVNQVGTINFYLGVATTNNNNAVTGDYTYTSTLQLQPSTAGIAKNVFDIADLKLYPNPAVNKIYISSASDLMNNSLISIYTIFGEEITKIKNGNSKLIDLDISGYPNGLYFLNIHSDKGNALKKFIVSK